MLRIAQALRREDGGVLVMLAILLPLLLLLAGGGIATFTISGAHRELQRAADQGALAGAAALPPFDPNVLVENAPFPIPSTDDVVGLVPPESITIVDGIVQQVDPSYETDIPRMRDLVPDPRVVACEVASNGNLGSASAALVDAFQDASGVTAPVDPDGQPRQTVCEDLRVYPVIELNPVNTTPVECTNRLVQRVAADVGSIDPTVDIVLDPVLTPVQGAVNTVVRMPLNHVLPAAFTPRMRVDAYTFMRPPLFGLLGLFPKWSRGETGGQVGNPGLTLHAGATAYRRIKNAVVVPILPTDQALIALGLKDPIGVMTDISNLNRALDANQEQLITAIDDADNQLDEVMRQYTLPCEHLLHNMRQDLRDIYSAPSGPAPTARSIVRSAVDAARDTARRRNIPEPDVTDPTSLAGEAFVLIGVAVTELMTPVAATQIPILDVALVSMSQAADGRYQAEAISAANAHGAFRATLVE